LTIETTIPLQQKVPIVTPLSNSETCCPAAPSKLSLAF
jgi:hypothetical protein